MSWTYVNTLATDRDRVRWLVGDTDTARQLVQDEEIAWVLTQEPNIYIAAAVICEQLAARGREVSSESVGDLSVSYDPAAFKSRAAMLRTRGGAHGVPTSADTSIAEQQKLKDDSDWPKPMFDFEMHDNESAESEES